jgi:hypothetical protein
MKKIIKKVIQILLSTPIINTAVVCVLKQKLLKEHIWSGEIMQDAIEKQINIFLSEEQLHDHIFCDKITTDIIASYYRYGVIPSEYFLFDFPNCNHQKRKTFLTLKHKDEVMIKKVGFGYNWDILENKDMFYEKFKEYFHRDVCIVKESSHFELFKTFVSKHSKFIAKPINGQCGKGVRIIDLTNQNYTSEHIFNELLGSGKWILEELVESSPEITRWNPSSLNTIRIPSFLIKNGFFVLKPFFRIGRKGCVVDNANAGGILVVIDEVSGIILTDGVDMRGTRYEKHPDSQLPFKGYQIPEWEALLKLAEEIHRTKMPNYPYIGWDFALTPKGWVLIEGNWGEFVSEFADREGIKEKFDSMFD